MLRIHQNLSAALPQGGCEPIVPDAALRMDVGNAKLADFAKPREEVFQCTSTKGACSHFAARQFNIFSEIVNHFWLTSLTFFNSG